MAQDKEPVKSTNKAPCSLPKSDSSSPSLNTNSSIGGVKKTCDKVIPHEDSSSSNRTSAITLHNLLLSGKQDKDTSSGLTNGSSKGKIRPVSMQALLSNGTKAVSVEAAAARLRSCEVTITKVKAAPQVSSSSVPVTPVLPDLCLKEDGESEDDEDDAAHNVLPTEPVCVIKEEPPEEGAGCDIAYVCRGCGDEFYSSALGGYYYCSRCSGLYVSCSICQVHFYNPLPTGSSPLCPSCSGGSGVKRKRDVATGNDGDRHCLACSTPFRCGAGDWNYCARCVAKSGSETGTLFNCATCGAECRTTLERCSHCPRCTSLYTVTRRSSNAQYQRYICKVCNGVFYSCGRERQKCTSCVRRGRPPAQTFVRRDVVYLRRSCVTCSAPFYSSSCGSDQCRKCRTQDDGADEEESNGEEEDKWANVVYEKYICQACGNSFYSRAGDYRYCGDCNPEIRVEKRPIWRCAHCPFTASLKRELRRHLWSAPRSIKCRCSVCGTTAPPTDEVNQLKKKYQCRKCDFSSPSRKRYKTHKKFHKTSGGLFLKCRFCCFGAPEASVMRRHVVKEHRKVIVCRYCDYMTKQRGRMKRHIKESHPDRRNVASNKKVLICTRCYYTTVQPGRYQNHIASCTVTNEKTGNEEELDDKTESTLCTAPNPSNDKDNNDEIKAESLEETNEERTSADDNEPNIGHKNGVREEENNDSEISERKKRTSANENDADEEEDHKMKKIKQDCKVTNSSAENENNFTEEKEESVGPLFRCSEPRS